MFISFIILLREVFEISLIIGILFAYINQSKKNHYKKFIWWGLFTGIMFSIFIGFSIKFGLIQFSHTSKELFEAIAMIIGGILMLSFIYWIYRQKKAFEYIKEKLFQKNNHINALHIFALTTISVLREGFEIILFFIAANVHTSIYSYISGLIAIILAISIGYGIYRGGMKLPIKLFFKITNIFLIIIALYTLFLGIYEIGELFL